MPINYNNYPKDWKKIRERILDRAGQCCEHCGVQNYTIGSRDRDGTFHPLFRNESPAKAKQVIKLLKKNPDFADVITIILTVAHLDHDEWNHKVEDDRLAALCQYHHFQYDRHDNNQRKKYGKRYRISVPILIE